MTALALWRAARRVYAEPGLKTWRLRARYIGRGWRSRRAVAALLDAAPGTALARAVAERPELLGFVDAPYLSARWDTMERVDAYIRQFGVLDGLGRTLNFGQDASVALLPLPELGDAYHLILEKPAFFCREGQITLSLFKDNTRLFSLSFAIDRTDEGLVGIIGGVQGRNLPGMLDEYRAVTKAGHGLRPRDLLLEVIRMILGHHGVTSLMAVSDRDRHHRHPYFGPAVDRELAPNYDDIWTDRGGVLGDDGFFRLPIASARRAVDDIPPKKRQSYRRRYAWLDELDSEIARALTERAPSIRPEAD